MVQTKVVEEIKTHILCSETFFFRIHAIYEIMWKIITEPDRPQMTIPKATNTHSVYVTLIAFSLQQWSDEPASVVLRNTLSFLLNSCL